jgi:transcriptional regulator
MYLRAVHAETRLKPLIEVIQNNPLGLLSTAISSDNFPLIQHTYLPWVLDPPKNLAALEEDGQAERPPVGNVKQPVQGLEGCRLRGHMARANPHAKALVEAMAPANKNSCITTEVTVSFSAPSQHYITPKWYVQTKPETGKVVPTWDYVAVEVRGKAKIIHDKEDPETSEYLQTQIEDLTRLSEGSLGYDSTPKAQLAAGGKQAGGKGTAWEVDDAPKPYIDIMKKAILGVEIEVTSIAGKWKMSQELKAGDRQGVKDGLRELKDAQSRAVADIVEVRSNGV